MEKQKVIFINPVFPQYVEIAQELLAPEFDVEPFTGPVERAGSMISSADALLVTGLLDEAAVRSARRARIIQVVGAGTDKIDLDAAGDVGIPVLTTGDANSSTVAEFVMMVVLVHYRRLLEFHNGMQRGEWNRSGAVQGSCRELRGKKVGLVGVGRVGRALARMLEGFGAGVRYNSRTRLHSDEERALKLTYIPLPDLLTTSDVISLQVPLTPETDGLIGREQFLRMAKNPLLVNVSRGAVVDEKALIDALTSGQICGAAIDVFEEEPLPLGHPLAKLDNVILSPHVAGITADAARRALVVACGNVRKVLTT